MTSWIQIISQRSSLRRCFYGLTGVLVVMAIAILSQTSIAQSPSRVLFENVRIFDGTSPKLSDPSYVLVEDNKIQAISDEPIAVTAVGDLTVIDGTGRTLMPGLSDAHWHNNLAITDLTKVLDPAISDEEAEANVRDYSQTAAADALMRGFTSVRDMGGNVFWLKKRLMRAN